jgi:hypothetical protein
LGVKVIGSLHQGKNSDIRETQGLAQTSAYNRSRLIPRAQWQESLIPIPQAGFGRGTANFSSSTFVVLPVTLACRNLNTGLALRLRTAVNIDRKSASTFNVQQFRSIAFSKNHVVFNTEFCN